MSGNTALVLGATGLVGRSLLTRLLADPRYQQVRVLVRRPLQLAESKLEQRLVDFEKLATETDAFRVDHVFCCLGTTLKQAGSRRAFRRVDYDYVLEAARLAAAADVSQFVWISAVGADPRSRIFYSRVKGELEQAVAALDLPGWSAVRPSLLLGRRDESRPAEALGTVIGSRLGWLLRGRLARYRPIAADSVAAGMIALANGERPPASLEFIGSQIASPGPR